MQALESIIKIETVHMEIPLRFYGNKKFEKV